MLSFNFPITHLFDKCLLCSFYTAHTVLNAGYIAVNKTNPCLLYIGGCVVEGQAIKIQTYIMSGGDKSCREK